MLLVAHGGACRVVHSRGGLLLRTHCLDSVRYSDSAGRWPCLLQTEA